MKNAIKWFSENHVAGNFLMLALVLVGMSTWFKLRKEIFPETSIDAIAVQVPYPNATPEEVERGVCVPVEEAVADLTGIKKLRSTATQNMGVVTIEVETGYDVREVMDDVKSRVDAIDNFPEEAEKPVLEEILIKNPVMSLAITTDRDVDEMTLTRLAEGIRDDLLTYEGAGMRSVSDVVASFLRGAPRISQVSIAGTRDYELSIEVSEDRLRELGLSHQQIAAAVRRTSVDLPGGSIRTEGGELIVRALGKRYTANEFRTIPVATRPDGSEVLLEDVAVVRDGFEDVDLSAQFDGKPAVLVNVYRVGEEDTLALARLVRDYVEHSSSRVPEGVKVAVWNDQSSYLRGRLELLQRNAVNGLCLVLLVLALFLRPSLALLVALGIPVSFAGGIWMMPIFGISINMISLFSFILVLGIVVDDAIVTGENVYSRIQAGEHPRLAAYEGTHEVSTVVIFGVLTTMAAFTPMLGLSGVSGKIWPNIPLVVIPTLAFSLLQSKFVLPAHLALLAPHQKERPRNPIFRLQRWVAGGLEKFVVRVYTPALELCLRWRIVTASAFIGLLVASIGFVAGGHVKFIFFPEVEGDILSAKFELPQGAPFSATQEIAKKLEQAAIEVGQELRNNAGEPVLRHLLASSGTQPFQTGFNPNGPPKATHLGEVTLEMSPAAGRSVTGQDFIDAWRKKAGDLPGLEEISFKAETAGGGEAFDFNLVGPDLQRLREATDWVKKELDEYAGVIDISDSNRAGKDELRLIRLTPQGKALGLRLDDVASQVRDAFYGNEVQRLQRGRDEVKVMVRYPQDDRRRLESLETMRIRTASGAEIPLPQVVDYEFGRGPAVINRTDRQRSIKVTADVEGATNANEVMSTFLPKVLDALPQKFPGVRYQQEGEQKDQSDSVREMGIGFLGALVMMYVLIAVPLKSYWQPLIIMSVIPFGLIGAIGGHLLLGMNLSIMSMCGLVALAGVVVNDSLVLVDFVNRHRDEEGSVVEAARKAGARRFRAILLTSLTTFAGLMPMLTETDVQARFLVPMAVSLGFGILFATVITLFLVPCVYVLLEDIRRLASRKTV
ncbi:multidrug efflux pump subunit AcrB [Haloferula luteola]|uniref:Multidrug efflux pump subunit AcrB n=1 Tax=Haloferula luteola TaxID=595692 RepID=A0A840VEB5_9BACT|nr:efflux RND transporter permease subunit [Haloferula luteola]MBB5352978.1 multidrug efflux pump subunit AcrB [Haloferula luteola]